MATLVLAIDNEAREQSYEALKLALAATLSIPIVVLPEDQKDVRSYMYTQLCCRNIPLTTPHKISAPPSSTTATLV